VIQDAYHPCWLSEAASIRADEAEKLPRWARALVIGALAASSWAVLMAPWWIMPRALSVASAWL
jgi:hypothetical protein